MFQNISPLCIDPSLGPDFNVLIGLLWTHCLRFPSFMFAGLWRGTWVPAAAQWRGAESSGGVRQMCERAEGAGSHETPVWRGATSRPGGTPTHCCTLAVLLSLKPAGGPYRHLGPLQQHRKQFWWFHVFFFKVSLSDKQTADFNVKVTGFPVLIHCPGPEEELGWAAPWVPGPLTRHRHLVKEGPQGAPGSGTEAAGDRHQPPRQVQDRLHTHYIGL